MTPGLTPTLNRGASLRCSRRCNTGTRYNFIFVLTLERLLYLLISKADLRLDYLFEEIYCSVPGTFGMVTSPMKRENGDGGLNYGR